MPATTASALWNTGRRVWTFLVLIAVPLTAQPIADRTVEKNRGVSRITLEPLHRSIEVSGRTSTETGHRLVWRSDQDGIQKISVSAPRAPGVWLRVSTDENPLIWKFVALETGRPKDLILSATRAWGSFQLQYDQIGRTSSLGYLPVVFTLTES